MNTKYIIEYLAGSKGDLLVRFLNRDPPNFINNNRTLPNVTYINWLKLANPYALTLQRFEEVLVNNDKNYVSAHPLWVTLDNNYLELLDKYNYKIIKVSVAPKHYMTVRIESILKNIVSGFSPYEIIEIFNSVYYQGKDLNSFIFSDVQPKEINTLVITWQQIWNQRADVFRLFDKVLVNNRQITSYDSLFLNFTSDLLNEYDLDEWKILVSKSWCDFERYGYRKNIIQNEILETPYGKELLKFIKEKDIIKQK